MSSASDDAAGINLATVYRNLRALGDAGEVESVACVGQPARYELAGLDHHHHFLCRDCDRLFDLTGCIAEVVDRLAPEGFEVQTHEVQLVGTCRDCRGA